MYSILLAAGDALFKLIILLVLVNVVFSWVRPNPSNPIVKFIYSVTEPLLDPFKRINFGGPIDFSPILLYAVISFIVQPLYNVLLGLIFLR